MRFYDFSKLLIILDNEFVLIFNKIIFYKSLYLSHSTIEITTYNQTIAFYLCTNSNYFKVVQMDWGSPDLTPYDLFCGVIFSFLGFIYFYILFLGIYKHVEYGGRIYKFSSVQFTLRREMLFFATFLSFLWTNTMRNRFRDKF